MYRSHTCGDLRPEHIGETVKLAGWVQAIRRFGAITFVDLRDRYGITQVYFDEANAPKLDAHNVGREAVMQAEGTVIERHNKTDKIATGHIEVAVTGFPILNSAATPPFTIEEETDGGEDLRMKYRYLDLRRAPLRRNLELRYRTSRAVRAFLDRNDFWEIETPFLIKSTPEGARDFVVPSRMNEGQFYALPQSPQTFKQLLMVSGYDRYYQIVKCFRDEDLRADRQPEFTQIDCEMSFVEQEDILQIFERLFKEVVQEVRGITLDGPLPRMTWDDAMRDYGNDKPDLRFGMKLQNLKVEGTSALPLLENTLFPVFQAAETVLGIVLKDAAEWSRKQTDVWADWVKRPQVGMSGLVVLRCNADGSYKSTADKFYSQQDLREIADFCGAGRGDMVLMVAGAEDLTRKAASALRLALADALGLRADGNDFRALWVIDFPLFEYDDEGHRFVARHHPFTAPKPEHLEWMGDTSKYHDIKANAYDLVLNGTEIGGGSIRIHQRDIQEKMFSALGMSAEEQKEKFGFLLGAFEYGAPPHGGIALGFDRLCALLGGQETIRDFIAFPKNNSGRDVMLDAPSVIDDVQRKELGL